MPFIPNYDSASYPVQAEPDSEDFEILLDGVAGNGVISGCAVSAQGTPDTTVAVASGSILYAGTTITVTGGNVTILSPAADTTYGRLDLVYATTAGAVAKASGTASNIPVLPVVPANAVALAAVYIPPTAGTITTGQITDKRVLVKASVSTSDSYNVTFGIR